MSTQQGDNVSETARQNNPSKPSADTQKQPQQEVPAINDEETAQQKLFRQLQSIY